MVEFRWMEIAAASALIVAVVLGFVAYNTAWVQTDGADEGGAAPKALVGEHSQVSYGADNFDDVKGVGLASTGGVLMLIGLIAACLAVFAYEHRMLTGIPIFSTIGFGAAALATLLLVVALILFPIGAGGMAASGYSPADLDLDVEWKSGLYLGVFSTVFALVGGVLASVVFLRESDFSLEAMESTGPAKFD